jgi:lipoprotein-releasing system permease protein
MLLSVGIIKGFKEGVYNKVYDFVGHIQISNFQVNPNSIITDWPMERQPAFEKWAKDSGKITYFQPVAYATGILQNNKGIEGVVIKGAEALMHDSRAPGWLLNAVDSLNEQEILISKLLVKRLGIKVGDQVMLYGLSQEGSAARVRKITIKGLYHTGIEEIDKSIVLAPITLAQKFNNWTSEQLSEYQVYLPSNADKDGVIPYIKAHYVRAPLVIKHVEDVFFNLFNWLHLLDANVVLLIVIMGVVCAVNIFTILLLLMIDRIDMLALLAAMGASQSLQRRILTFMTLKVVLGGVLIGNIMALLFSWIQNRWHLIPLDESVYYTAYVPVQFTIWDVLILNMGIIGVSTLLLSIMSYTIRKMTLVSALRFK